MAGEGGSSLSSVIFCFSALRCSSLVSLFLCVSLCPCVSLTLFLCFPCVSPTLPFFLLLLLLSSSSPPQPSLMHIIEFSLDHGCPFLQLILPTLVPPQLRCSPFALSLGFQQL